MGYGEFHLQLLSKLENAILEDRDRELEDDSNSSIPMISEQSIGSATSLSFSSFDRDDALVHSVTSRRTSERSTQEDLQAFNEGMHKSIRQLVAAREELDDVKENTKSLKARNVDLEATVQRLLSELDDLRSQQIDDDESSKSSIDSIFFPRRTSNIKPLRTMSADCVGGTTSCQKELLDAAFQAHRRMKSSITAYLPDGSRIKRLTRTIQGVPNNELKLSPLARMRALEEANACLHTELDKVRQSDEEKIKSLEEENARLKQQLEQMQQSTDSEDQVEEQREEDEVEEQREEASCST